MIPPPYAKGKVTDEDSGDEEHVRPSDLPGSQPSALAEIYSDNRNQDTEDEISLAELVKKLKGRTKGELSLDKWRPRSSANGMAIFHRC
ncbi:hypothetical protein HHI36_003433 [Cryptolaemus montrouzieri]|uniref:Uncharacterized protein n=1 Tax=Cryptolaemus montrouzieri TaxID=559131 RepID=A0ABD2PDJ2_9CUCU